MSYSSLNALHSPSVSMGQSFNNYNDVNALQSIKFADKGDAKRLDAAAKQFESMFVSLMLKSMRSANAMYGEDNPLNSSSVQFYQDMYDSQLAVSLSQSKGIGIADVLKQQLAGRYGQTQGEYKTQADPAKTAASIVNYERQHFANSYTEKQLEEALEQVDQGLAQLAQNEAQTIVQTTAQAPAMLAKAPAAGLPAPNFSSPQAYIESLLPYAQAVEQETGIDARLMLAQSALETGWGKHQIKHADGSPSYNLFGIKAQAGWQGERADIVTTEYRGGVAMKERAEFRAYGSYQESFSDYANFLQSNQRYADALAHRAEPVEFAHALQSSGYATDPAYGSKIEQIINRYLPDAPSSVSGSSVITR